MTKPSRAFSRKRRNGRGRDPMTVSIRTTHPEPPAKASKPTMPGNPPRIQMELPTHRPATSLATRPSLRARETLLSRIVIKGETVPQAELESLREKVNSGGFRRAISSGQLAGNHLEEYRDGDQRGQTPEASASDRVQRGGKKQGRRSR